MGLRKGSAIRAKRAELSRPTSPGPRRCPPARRVTQGRSCPRVSAGPGRPAPLTGLCGGRRGRARPGRRTGGGGSLAGPTPAGGSALLLPLSPLHGAGAERGRAGPARRSGPGYLLQQDPQPQLVRPAALRPLAHVGRRHQPLAGAEVLRVHGRGAAGGCGCPPSAPARRDHRAQPPASPSATAAGEGVEAARMRSGGAAAPLPSRRPGRAAPAPPPPC